MFFFYITADIFIADLHPVFELSIRVYTKELLKYKWLCEKKFFKKSLKYIYIYIYINLYYTNTRADQKTTN